MGRLHHGTVLASRRPPAVGLSSPKSILGSKIVLELDADVGVTSSGGLVSAWADQSGLGNSPVQATGANKPSIVANVLNGHAAMRFDGARWLAMPSGFTGIAAGDFPRMYVIASWAGDISTFNGHLVSLCTSSYIGMVIAGISQNVYMQEQRNAALKSGGAQPITPARGVSSNPGLFDVRNDPTAFVLRFQDTSEPVSFALTATGLDVAIARMTIGADYTASVGSRLVGDIFRVVVVNPPPTAAEHLALMAYFRRVYPSMSIWATSQPNARAAAPTLAQINGSSLVLDLNSDVGVTLGTGVASWADSSGKSSLAVVQATPANQPTVIANALDGHAAIQFATASQQCLQATSGLVGVAAGDKPRVYVVMGFDSPGATNQTVFETSDNGSSSRVQWFDAEGTSTYFRDFLGGAGTSRDAIMAGTLTGPKLYDGQINSADQSELSVNGVSVAVSSSATAGGLTRAPTGISIGKYMSIAANWLQGKIYRIAMVNPPPSAVQHAANLEYFRRTYPSVGLGDAYQAILGGLMVERWDCRQNVYAPGGNVLAWKGTEKGYALQPPTAANAPTLAVDTGFFNNIPVVQCATTGTKYLRNQALPAPLFVAGTRPYMIIVARHRTTPAAYSMMFYARGSDAAGFGLYVNGPVNQMGAYAGTTTLGAFAYAGMTSPSANALYFASNGASTSARDGVSIGTAGAAGTMSVDQTELYLGNRYDGAQGGDLSIAMVIACSSAPSTQQLLALAKQIRDDFATADSYQSILGTLLVELWDAQGGIALSGSNIISWTGQVLGTALPAPAVGQRPLYAADGSLFGGKSVIQTTTSGTKNLRASGLATPLLLAGTRPYWYTLGRLRTQTGSVQVLASSGKLSVDDNQIYVISTGLNGALAGFPGLAATIDLARHSFQISANGTNESMSVDNGTPVTAASTASMPNNVNCVAVGGNSSAGTQVGDWSIAVHLICASRPSAAQIAAIEALTAVLYP